MRYAEFRADGLFVGSGAIEAGCKAVISGRLKRSGMGWSLTGANNIITLRCVMKSGRLEDYREDRGAEGRGAPCKGDAHPQRAPETCRPRDYAFFSPALSRTGAPSGNARRSSQGRYRARSVFFTQRQNLSLSVSMPMTWAWAVEAPM